MLWCLCVMAPGLEGVSPRGSLLPPAPRHPGPGYKCRFLTHQTGRIRVSGEGPQDSVFLQVPRVQFGGPALELPGLSCGYSTR